MNLTTLYNIILDRKENPTQGSYVSSLFARGIDRIAQKVGEEATEVVIASKNTDKDKLVGELADLWFHTLVLMCENSVTIKDVTNELSVRHKAKQSATMNRK